MKSVFFLLLLTILYGSLHFIGVPVENPHMLAWILLGCSIVLFSLFFQQEKWLIKASVILSLLLQISFVFLNDTHNDIYKYLWEGYGSAQEMKTYETYAWQTYEQHPPETEAGQQLWEQVNFKKYYTTYPPIPQLVFWTAAKIQPFSQAALKAVFLLFQMGSMWLMWSLFRKTKNKRVPSSAKATDGTQPFVATKWLPVLYLSPLFLWEGAATGHTEILFLFFMLLTLWCWQRKQYFCGGMALAGVIWSKFFPAILIPLFLWQIFQQQTSWLHRVKNTFVFGLGGIFMTIAAWYLFWPFDPQYLLEALGIYSGNWQMSPLYFAVFESFWGRDVASQIHFFAPFLMLAIVMLRKISLEKALFLVLTTFLLFSSTIFSWYFLWLLAFVPYIWEEKNWRYLLISLATFPLQYFFGYVDGEYGFRYEDNGARWDQILFFWLPLLCGALVTFGMVLKDKGWKCLKDCSKITANK